jgi:hypothetical protein
MKTIVIFSAIIYILSFSAMNDAIGQWSTNGNYIYNANAGYVGIGSSTPSTLLYVAKNMAEPAITVRNLGGTGGATYSMIDDASGAGWKFKATNAGGFKVRDHAYGLDVFTIESNSFDNALYINSEGSMGMGTNIPTASAALEINSTTMGFIPPRMTLQQISMVSNPANGLVVYNTSDEHLYVYSSVSASWKRVSYGSQTITPNTCPPFSITHTAGNVAPVTKTVTYGTVMTDLSGDPKCWITQNLGADHQATSGNDATEESAGWYWQFNRQQGYKHDGTTVTPAWTITYISENSDWQPANDPCTILLGLGWRLPSLVEWNNANDNGGWDNYNDTYSSVLKLHAAGYMDYSDGSLWYRAFYGNYWSSSQDDDHMGYFLGFTNSFCGIGIDYKADGRSIRCLRD